jgi:ribonuclease HII
VPCDPLAALFAELGRLRALSSLERELARRGYRFVAGVDEVGRGCLAGPVVAAAVILPLDCVLPGLDDSKRLDAESREKLDREVRQRAVAFAVGHVEASQIDERDILRASLTAMRQAIEALSPAAEALLVDAVTVPGVRRPQLPVVHGDALCASIAAASIVAKVYRDALLGDLARRYPAYGFEHHKGYGTSEHWEALRLYGPCPEHRLSFEGVISGTPRPEPPAPEKRRRGRVSRSRRPRSGSRLGQSADSRPA